MKLRQPPLAFFSAFFITMVFLATFLTGTCAASLTCSNNITLEKGGMSWEYEECINDREAVFFRELIDREMGNNDSFVNAWEIRNMELELRDRMKKSIEEKPDVKLGGSSEKVKLLNVEFLISHEALGRVHKTYPITNSAKVTYIFDEDSDENNSEASIWLLGTPGSEVTITLSSGYDAKKTEGLENKSEEFENSLMILKGNFGPEREISLWLSENESYEKAALMEALNGSELLKNETAKNESHKAEGPDSQKTGAEAGFFENLLRRICLSPKA